MQNQFIIHRPGQPDVYLPGDGEHPTQAMKEKVDGVKGGKISISRANGDQLIDDVYPPTSKRLWW